MRKMLACAAAVVAVAFAWGSAAAQEPPPAPTIAVQQSTTIVGSEGEYLSPADRAWSVSVTWEAEPGFTGNFEVERSDVSPDGARLPFRLVGAGAGDQVRFEDRFPFWALNAQRCYRVRAVADGLAGPYSNEVCTELPPSTGHGGVPADAPFFFPPDVATRVITVDGEGTPLPEAAYELEITVTWREFSGFDGVFEVERSVSYDVDAQHVFDLVATVAADDRVFVDRFPAAEQYSAPHCYRIRTLEDGTYGPYTPMNCHIPPTDGPGFIQKPPTGMRMEITRPADGRAAATVSWDPLVGYSGQFEVQRGIVRFTGDLRADLARIESGPFESVSVLAADNPVYTEQFPAIEEHTMVRCYRVRAVAGGLVGPFGRLVCTVPPPDGPVPLLPPGVGTGLAPAAGQARFGPIAAGVVALLFAAMARAHHRKQ